MIHSNHQVDGFKSRTECWSRPLCSS